MGMQIRRKLYPRGGSYETTIPSQLLFALDQNQKYDVLFIYDVKLGRWMIEFDQNKSANKKRRKNG